MHKEIIEKLTKAISHAIEEKGEYADFGDKRYKPVKICAENFHNIEEKESSKSIAFIDGGNLELVRAPNFSLQFIRVYYGIYKKNKRAGSEKFEFYLFVSAKKEEGIVYETECFPISYDMGNMKFDSFDKTLRVGNNRVEINAIGNTVRRLSEIKIAEDIDADIIVLDGNLKAQKTFEKEYFAKLYGAAMDKGKAIAALSKTNELLTDKGGSLLAELDSYGIEGEWYYYPIAESEAEEHKSDMYGVKMDANSQYVFKLEIFQQNNHLAKEIIWLLAQNSKDPVFLGYPYGLVEADRNARVSQKEKEMLQLQIMAKYGDKWKSIRKYLNNLNAHEILDNIS